MGNHKMRLSNIIPNAWFHKLKEMGMITTNKSTRNRNQPFPATTTIDILDQDAGPSPSLPRKSYHFTRKRRPTSKKTTNSTPTPSFTTTTKSSSSSSVSAACSCRSTATATVQSTIRSKPGSSPIQESPPSSSPDQILRSFDRMVAWSSASGHCTSIISPIPDNDNDNNDDDHNDVVIGVDKMSLRCKTGEDPMSRVGLSPIRTDHKKFNELVKEIGEADEQLLLIDNPNKQRKSSVKYRSNISTGSGSPRVRIRINSPKLSKRMENGGGRRSTSRGGKRKKSISRESLAVVKSSSDPERDFRESMMEMIAENEMRGSEELEELLACYLSLNSAEYHHLIVHVFQQIWFDLYHIR